MPRIDIEQRTHWIALSLSPHIGAKTLTLLLRHFDDDLRAICAASPVELLRAPGIGPAIVRAISSIDLESVADAMAQWQAGGVRVLMPGDVEYPNQLRDTAGHPPTLFVRGRCLEGLNWNSAIAIVGTRHPSPVAKSTALQLSMKLARAGRLVVSGLAVGIDAAAHASAMSAGGATVAVLGSGVLNVYPPQNRHLANGIQVQGALVSETHPRARTNAQRLVSRNRIISALAKAVVVVESDEDAGALHAARFARKQGRRLYTFNLPASGNQQLIKEGAALLPIDLERALGYLLR